MVRIPLAHRIASKGSTRPPNDDALAADSKHLILRTSVLRGRNLAAKDRNGTSDPYLVVTLGDSRQSTPTISKTLNPEWHVSFDLPVVGVPLLECVCWDKDRFGKDYMGEFDIPLEDLFADGRVYQEPQWYDLRAKFKTGKDNDVSGQIQLQFSLYDASDLTASPEDICCKFSALVTSGDDDEEAIIPASSDDKSDATSDETTDDPARLGSAENRRRKLRLAKLRDKSIAARAYEFSGAKDGVSGIVFLEVGKVLDLPPEKNVTRTSFDMDPFVVTSLGRKTLRTRVIRHNLNPVFDEKMVFQVMKHEQTYSFSFTIMDRDKLSGNDFVASANFPLQNLIHAGPVADPETGLYRLSGLFETPVQAPAASKSRFRLTLSRSSSASSLSKLARPGLKSKTSATSLSSQFQVAEQSNHAHIPTPCTSATQLSVPGIAACPSDGTTTPPDTDDLKCYVIPLTLKNKDRWEDKHFPELHVRAKYMPYAALRQQFWKVMLKQYDADESGRISKVELTTMLDTLGSTLKESTIDSFFHKFANENEPSDTIDLTFDQAVICLEETLQTLQKSAGSHSKNLVHISPPSPGSENLSCEDLPRSLSSSVPLTTTSGRRTVSHSTSRDESTSSEDGPLHPDDLADERGEEHVIELRECPLCHQPRLEKRSDSDIITHIATCASQDWRQVDNLVMGGFVTSSQAQRKWYSKVITKISYGGYKLGANSANILVQDRITGQINEERMSVYVRLGIRLLYKGLKSRDMEKKRIRKMLKSLSIKQGRKYDDPASAGQIEGFMAFHQLDLSEVLLPLDEFRTFNEFFYRALKPGARPCSAPNNPDIIVSPADCRSVVFDRIDDATKIWVKGREFSLARLLGKAYPEDVERYKGGALGIFRLAPQDYHRFHIPVDGVMDVPKTIEGEYYTVNPMAIRSALDVYGENIRILVPINSIAHGRVMVICVGAMMVGSTVITRQAGERVTRAEELGYFKFGGSTILVLFEPGRMNFDSDLTDNSKGALETLIRVGMSIGHSPHVAQYTPDMRKPDELVSGKEREEANRRIGGNLAPTIKLEVSSH
ncbi:phosphatidylserine decarboxylase [Ophidiomyces ophidiicola]|uniref:Phosphatidylserine decarboxylase n=1 Tax=Ophidiomyces ophidiicola TaxID=1387563 RepID=A0ACB8UP36_9EURO|nr:phosphatidylserine decarboxylase [Ophidiomyces ophidiicola]KAI1912776.1 phosphatidylserine decarboxylase [Ophidiomyces ophidiicola]KAI1931683.1 phosphatidylserine decarboxylase [Ophidiomyces ophidiicola]KAI1950586.1 phosphatidylserine decarboxylase [Ophidiomyces ophidiicola]KAI1951627.1 phosphatidylserine decarboxylase [Ophidiomyces ophidiicola]KAI1960924.1 phosphatidylserine decarboxylase [Ophidiomyces ophidiicola]